MSSHTKSISRGNRIARKAFPFAVTFLLGAWTARFLAPSLHLSPPPPPVHKYVQLPETDFKLDEKAPFFPNAPMESRKLPAKEVNLSRLLFPEAESIALVELMRRLHVSRNGMITYLEYGSGGSTTELTPFVNVAISVEHHMGWCSLIKQRLAEAAIKNVFQICVPPERRNFSHSGFGWEGDYVGYKNYIEAVERPGLPQKYDVVLIDGRARMAVALEVLPYLHNDSVVVVHDAIRNWYNPLDQFYVIEESNLNFATGSDKNGHKVMRMRGDIPHFPRGYEIQDFYYQTLKKDPSSGAISPI